MENLHPGPWRNRLRPRAHIPRYRVAQVRLTKLRDRTLTTVIQLMLTVQDLRLPTIMRSSLPAGNHHRAPMRLRRVNWMIEGAARQFLRPGAWYRLGHGFLRSALQLLARRWTLSSANSGNTVAADGGLGSYSGGALHASPRLRGTRLRIACPFLLSRCGSIQVTP